MRALLRRMSVFTAVSLVAGLVSVFFTPPALAGTSDGDCAFADSITATECVISAAWTVGGGGVVANNFPSALPGPFAFHKTLHVTNTGSINALGTSGITLNIDATAGGGTTGALVMDAGASVINASEDGSPPNDGAGPISITATGGAQTASGSVIKSENNVQGGNAGSISMILGATSTLDGLISSQATAGTTSNNGGDITINVTAGDLVVSPTGEINSQKHADSGKSGDISITVAGDMTMQGSGSSGALITSEHPGATSGTPGGNITIKVGTGDQGVFTMQPGTRVDSSSQGSAGNIAITAGKTVDVQTGAKVLAGQRATQDTRGHGGRIFVVAGCLANILGTLSSQGNDPGADLVHVEGCEVHVGPQGLIESIGGGHEVGAPSSCDNVDDPATTPGGDAGEVLRDHPSNSTECVEIWGPHITIDQGGEVKADFAQSGGVEGHGWVDVFAEQDVTINGPASGSVFAVHSNVAPLPNANISNGTGGDVTVKAKNSFVKLRGLALQANDTTNGGDGGHIVVESNTLSDLDGATLQARGDNSGASDLCDSGAGACGAGGAIDVRSFNDAITWQNGVGDVNPDNPGFPGAGTITLTACTTVTTTGTNFGDETPTVSEGTACGGEPSFPAYVIFNPDGRWDRCGEISISGQKRDGDTNAGLDSWVIHLYGPNDPTSLLDTQTTAGGGYYSFGNLAPGIYKVCEVLQTDWTEQSPASGPSCGGTNEGPVGYEINTSDFITCCNGADIDNIDFENVHREVPCPGRLTITKTIPAPDTVTFTFDITSPNGFTANNVPISFVPADGTTKSVLVTPLNGVGTYTVTEDTPSAPYGPPIQPDPLDINEANDCAGTVTFRNFFAPGEVDLLKTENGGTAIGHWVFHITGPDAASSSTQTLNESPNGPGFSLPGLTAGDYTVCEDPFGSWQQSLTVSGDVSNVSGNGTHCVSFTLIGGGTATISAANVCPNGARTAKPKATKKKKAPKRRR